MHYFDVNSMQKEKIPKDIKKKSRIRNSPNFIRFFQIKEYYFLLAGNMKKRLKHIEITYE